MHRGRPHSPGTAARVLAGDCPGAAATRALVPPCGAVCPPSGRAALEDPAGPAAERCGSAVGLGRVGPQDRAAQEGPRPGPPGGGPPPRVDGRRRRGTADHAVRPGIGSDELQRVVVGRPVSVHAVPGAEDPTWRDQTAHPGNRHSVRYTNETPAPARAGSRRLRGVVGQRPARHPDGIRVGGYVGCGRPSRPGAGVAGSARGVRETAA